MRANASLTRVDCAGIVDADAYDTDEIAFFESKGIGILPVSEIENMLLLPPVIGAIAAGESYKGNALTAKIASVLDELFAQAAVSKNQLPVVMRYCRRRIDRTLKKIDLSETADVLALASQSGFSSSSFDLQKCQNEDRRPTDGLHLAL